MVEGPLAEGIVGAGDRAGADRRPRSRPARLHDRSASRGRRCAVWRRARDGAEAGAAVRRGRSDSRAAWRRRRCRSRGDPDVAGRRAPDACGRERLSAYDGLRGVCAGGTKGSTSGSATHLATETISIGDYVVSGGELPALVIVDAVARLIPGVVGDEASVAGDTFARGLLDFPQYTRPAEFRGYGVRPVLLSGHHKEIEKWRRRRRSSERRRRPDLIERCARRRSGRCGAPRRGAGEGAR